MQLTKVVIPHVSRHIHLAIAPKAKKEVFAKIRQWCLHRRSDLSVTELANMLNPVVRGGIEYYGAFFPSKLIFLMYHLDKLIYRWVNRKYKKHGSNFKRAENWIKRIKRKAPNDKSRMNREVHVRFCEKLRGGSPCLLEQTFIQRASHFV